jgi:AraC-like DNA-binding protein
VSAFLKDCEPVLPLQGLVVLLATTQERGVDPEHVLRGTGITAAMLVNDQARISYSQLGRAIDNAIELTGDAALGMECGRKVHIGHVGVLGTALMSQPSIGAALDILVKYSGIFIPAWELTLERRGPYAMLQAMPTIQLQRITFAAEMLFGCLKSLVSFLTGAPMQFHKVEATFAAPPYAHRYRDLTDAPITFQAERNAAWFDAGLLDHPIAYANPLTAQAAERYCASQLSIRGLRGPLEQARQFLRRSGPQAPSLSDLARALRVSDRQLRRELHAEGTSYRQLLDEVRKQRAIDLLLGSGLTVEEIARELGFQDSRHFRRRFKFWHGSTPMAFRVSHGERA